MSPPVVLFWFRRGLRLQGTNRLGVHLRFGTVSNNGNWKWAAGCGCLAAYKEELAPV